MPYVHVNGLISYDNLVAVLKSISDLTSEELRKADSITGGKLLLIVKAVSVSLFATKHYMPQSRSAHISYIIDKLISFNPNKYQKLIVALSNCVA